MNLKIDVRAALQSIHVPTLILHENSDGARGSAQYLHDHIARARMLEVPETSHFWFVNPAVTRVAIRALRDLVGDLPESVESDRFLTTVLFAEIVGSTRRAAEMGDRAWGQLPARYLDSVRKELARSQGRLIKTTGDGVLATFDGPTRAIRCACALRDRAHELRLEIRAGLHSGECIFQGNDVQGIAVHFAPRVSNSAVGDEVVVSRTVRDLAMGADIRFEDRGTQSFKGPDGEWRTYSVTA